MNNARNLLDASELLGGRPLPPSFAEAMLTTSCPAAERLDDWLGRLESMAVDPPSGRRLAEELRSRIGWHDPERSEGRGSPTSLTAGWHVPDRSEGRGSPASLTFHRTARRSFETAYWRTIRTLAHGRYITKDNGDCAKDPVTRQLRHRHHRDLDALGDYLLAYYRKLVEKAGMADRVAVGDLPFRWQTDFGFPWLGGWLDNQQGKTEERDLAVVIPGRDRRRAIIMADHYDTAYMEDCYEKERGGSGARLAARRRRRQPLGHRRADAGRPDLPRAEPRGPAGLRYLAGTPDGRGIPFRLPGRKASRRVRHRGLLEAAPLPAPAGRSVEDADRGRLRARHDRPQQRSAARRVPDLAGHGRRLAAAG